MRWNWLLIALLKGRIFNGGREESMMLRILFSGHSERGRQVIKWRAMTHKSCHEQTAWRSNISLKTPIHPLLYLPAAAQTLPAASEARPAAL